MAEITYNQLITKAERMEKLFPEKYTITLVLESKGKNTKEQFTTAKALETWLITRRDRCEFPTKNILENSKLQIDVDKSSPEEGIFFKTPRRYGSFEVFDEHRFQPGIDNAKYKLSVVIVGQRQ